ncbi:hypothetical protein CP533_6655 [Ophiocordyceps camponoti-saundersi (nom. inval.)]|nr:hypothetical protein CP533_6655 [Ophiocordyceps camponoti-saundersi (nom. inval.)]
MAENTMEEEVSTSDLITHLTLLSLEEKEEEPITNSQLLSSPIFTEQVRTSGKFNQYGLLGGQSTRYNPTVKDASQDPRIFYNVSAPSSVFICGSQGSGKSHTLSCILENCLLPCEANVLPNPLTGLVLHFDAFVSEVGGSPCEAAYLSSNPGVRVRVLCPPTNMARIKDIYKKLPNLTVEALQLDERDLNTKRMLDLMAISSIQGGGMPLYLHVVTRILRDLRIEQQQTGGTFNYAKFRSRIENEDMTPGQMAPLQQRLDTLQSFMVKEQVSVNSLRRNKATTTTKRGINWEPKAGQLTIIDLSCPCVTADAACALFNICVSLFLEQPSEGIGRVIALDEAHRYMNQSEESASSSLTETLLTSIRVQRHIGTRVIISTQEPTISPKLLDLCSVTIVHRFSSPDWFRVLKRHLATEEDDDNYKFGIAQTEGGTIDLFCKILALRQGEALLFAPNAIVAVPVIANGSSHAEETVGKRVDPKLAMLGSRTMNMRVRKRVTDDGGRTVMAP